MTLAIKITNVTSVTQMDLIDPIEKIEGQNWIKLERKEYRGKFAQEHRLLRVLKQKNCYIVFK